MREVFTTGQIAKICHVASRTVTKWIDRGHLKGWRVPLSKSRRVSREELEKFLAAHGMPPLRECDAFATQ